MERRHQSKESNEKRSKALKGIKRGPMSEEQKEKISESKKGRKYFNRKRPPKFTENHLQNLRKPKSTTINMMGRTGEKNPAWKGGVTPLNKIMRESSKMKIWRELVFLRDNFTCQNPNCKFCNNKVGVLLHPHHIQPMALFQELMFDVNNGITYCAEFHLKSGLHKQIQGGKIWKKIKLKQKLHTTIEESY